MDTKLWNKLTIHLELVIHMFNLKFFILTTFTFDAAIQNWKYNRIQYGAKSWGLKLIYIQPPCWGFFCIQYNY
jgi:hypothetical protein